MAPASWKKARPREKWLRLEGTVSPATIGALITFIGLGGGGGYYTLIRLITSYSSSFGTDIGLGFGGLGFGVKGPHIVDPQI